ncbi:uncharacterized protein VP01_2596g5 [Puccinia sorghi]|uniref:Uncharacterized protein n=1 Tax=Puccinia sorghi TaxID=27349 RepID=A0A0L6V5C2_9BASI|nr:uncharacterized protein VP01_2596g5 [Puccinia sorghi]
MSSSSITSRDPYYGYGAISMLSTSIVTTLFPPMVTTPEESYAVTETGKRLCIVPHSVERRHRSLCFIAVNQTQAALPIRPGNSFQSPSPVSISSDAGIKGTHALFPQLSLQGNHINLTSLAQMSMDDTYSNKSWVIVGQNMFSITEVNRMERELFGFLNSNCYVTKEELKSWCQEWCGHIDEDEADELYELEETVPHSGSSAAPSEATIAGCYSSDSHSPISCSTTTTSSPSPRTPEEGSEGEVESRNRWKSIEHPVNLLPSSAHIKPSTHAPSTIQHILNSPF